MSFEWADYLDMAKQLAQLGLGTSLEEARLRSAISRAYYGAFCKARNHLRSRHPHLVFPPGAEIHRFVRDQFQTRPEALSRAVAANLDRLRDWRNGADYEDAVPNLQRVCEAALLSADSVMTALGSL